MEPLRQSHSNLTDKQNLSSAWFKDLRNLICSEFEAIDGKKFLRKTWERPGGGGGEISIMHGNIFEKVGVNISTVYGEFPEQFRKEIPGTDKSPNFWASGISLVAHMKSPHIPAVHMNTRFIVTDMEWFGGGADLTPIYHDENDARDFHKAFEDTCNKFDSSYYPKFKKDCDEYFYLKHRKESRGIGGIFYDNLNSGDWDKDFNFTKEVGKTFLNIYSNIVKRHKDKPWTEEERAYQLMRRGRYVEFNLLYDRGTRFGLMTDGNVEAILMSLPPVVTWS